MKPLHFDVKYCSRFSSNHYYYYYYISSAGLAASSPSGVSIATINNEAFCRNKNTRPGTAVSNNKRGKLMEPVGGRVQRERACYRERTGAGVPDRHDALFSTVAAPPLQLPSVGRTYINLKSRPPPAVTAQPFLRRPVSISINLTVSEKNFQCQPHHVKNNYTTTTMIFVNDLTNSTYPRLSLGLRALMSQIHKF